MPSARVSPTSACFATGYGKVCGMILNEWQLAMLTIVPRPMSSIPGSTALAVAQHASRSSRKQRSHSPGGICSGSWKTLAPALLTRMSGCDPNASSVAGTRPATSSATVTSVRTNAARPPVSLIASATAAPVATFFSATSTAAPSAANARAIASPIP